MTKEPITGKAEIEKELARLVSCSLKAHALTSKAVVTDVEDWSHLIVSTERRLWAGTVVWLEFFGAGKTLYGFSAEVLEATSEGARISYPATVYRINRRNFCRVEAPAGSLATFQWQGRTIQADMVNVSAGGAALETEPFTQAVGAKLKDVELSLLGPDGALEQVSVPSAVVRHIRPGPGGKTVYGVAFSGLGKIAEALMYYVRRRERQLLREKREALSA